MQNVKWKPKINIISIISGADNNSKAKQPTVSYPNTQTWCQPHNLHAYEVKYFKLAHVAHVKWHRVNFICHLAALLATKTCSQYGRWACQQQQQQILNKTTILHTCVCVCVCVGVLVYLYARRINKTALCVHVSCFCRHCRADKVLMLLKAKFN